MDLNKFLHNKNIAIVSFAIFFLIALYLLLNDVKSFVLITIFIAATIVYLINKKKENRKDFSKTATKEEEEKSLCTPISSTLNLSDVAGLDEVKEELFEIKDFLKNSGKYKKFNARIPKGVLLVGPPGVGKTMIAKALAGEAEVPFFYQSGSSFVEIYVGMGAKKVHELFSTAKKSAPSIIFIDEIDSVGKARGGMRSDEREATLNQLLTEMDGFESNSGVIVIAATNKIEMLDSALLRAGRFDRHVHLDLPSVKERQAILNIYLKNRPNSVDIEKLAFITSGFSGAGLENFVNEASLNAIKLNKERIDTDDFMAVKDKVIFGKRQQIIFGIEEKEKIALYQSAKAVVAKKLGLEFEKMTLFLNTFLLKNNSMQSEKSYLNKAAAQIGGVVAYDMFYAERYSNMKEDILLAEESINDYLANFNLEKNISYQSLLEKAKEHATKIIKENAPEIETLQKRLIEREILYFNEI